MTHGAGSSPRGFATFPRAAAAMLVGAALSSLCLTVSAGQSVTGQPEPDMYAGDFEVSTWDAGTATADEARGAGPAGSLDAARDRLAQLPAATVKQVYAQCSAVSLTRRPGDGEAAMCSIVYDVLLTRHFGGDFHALLAWSRQQQQRAAARPDGPADHAGTDRAGPAPARATAIRAGREQ